MKQHKKKKKKKIRQTVYNKAKITSGKVEESITAVPMRRGRPGLGAATGGEGEVVAPGRSHSDSAVSQVPCALPTATVPCPMSRVPSPQRQSRVPGPLPVTSGMDSALPAPCPSSTARRGSALSARPGSFSCDIRISSSERKFSSMPSPGPTG